jgi:hypothetical protein
VPTNYCADGGFLVDSTEILPTDVHEFWTGGPPLVGCSNIVCAKCKNTVRHVEKRRVLHVSVESKLRELFDSPHPESSQLLPYDPYFRAYFCRCSWGHAGGVMLGASDLPWQCAGHPDDDAESFRRRFEGRAKIYQRALPASPDAAAAWDELFAQEGAAGVLIYRQLMNATRDWRVRGRASMALGRLTGDYSDAQSVLTATVANSEDAEARREAEGLLKEIP